MPAGSNAVVLAAAITFCCLRLLQILLLTPACAWCARASPESFFGSKYKIVVSHFHFICKEMDSNDME
jgi:hypothetical protein